MTDIICDSVIGFLISMYETYVSFKYCSYDFIHRTYISCNIGRWQLLCVLHCQPSVLDDVHYSMSWFLSTVPMQLLPTTFLGIKFVLYSL